MEESLKEPKNEKKPEKQSNISTCEILKAQFRKSTIQLAKIFVACESISNHKCVILQVQFQVSQPANQLAKWGNLRTNLRECQPTFKFLFKPLIFSIFIITQPFQVAKPPKFQSWKLRGHASEEEPLRAP